MLHILVPLTAWAFSGGGFMRQAKFRNLCFADWLRRHIWSDISQIDCVPTARAVGWLDDSLGWPLVLPFVLVFTHASTRLAPESDTERPPVRTVITMSDANSGIL